MIVIVYQKAVIIFKISFDWDNDVFSQYTCVVLTQSLLDQINLKLGFLPSIYSPNLLTVVLCRHLLTYCSIWFTTSYRRLTNSNRRFYTSPNKWKDETLEQAAHNMIDYQKSPYHHSTNTSVGSHFIMWQISTRVSFIVRIRCHRI